MFEAAKARILRIGVAGMAAAALVSATMAYAQEAPAPERKVQTRVITDPAEIEAILAECGLSMKARPKKSAEAPAAPPTAADDPKAGGAAPVKRRCNIQQRSHK